MQFGDATRVRRKGSPPTIASEVRTPKNTGAPLPLSGDPAQRSGALPIVAATPCGLARILAHDFVASHLLSRSKRRVSLRVLSQNRASASRVLSCNRLLELNTRRAV